MAWTYWFLFHIKQAKPARERTDRYKAEGLVLTRVSQAVHLQKIKHGLI